MLVCGQRFTDEVIRKINETVKLERIISRRALSLRVCQWLDWKSPNGKLKEMSCRVALLKMHRQGVITLPECSVKPSFEPCAERQWPIEPMGSVCCDLRELGGVELIRIGSRRSKTSRLWNALMDKYHYLGRGPLCGAQMRYLIKSPLYGWLGGLSFSGAAWRVEARDRWIGWSDAARKKHLGKVVCNSCFLILPQVQVPNLASHVLSLSAKRVAGDWLERYGFEPVLLESFVERNRFAGTCYRAANWVHVGSSCGRGRQDRERVNAVPVKDLYVLPLAKKAKEVLCCAPVNSAPRAQRKPSKSGEDWAEEEFGQADLGDRRLTRRLVSIVRDFYAHPQGSVPQACQSRAKTKAAYRFFEHPHMNMDKVLEQHYEATLSRVSRHRVVLAVQDTTTLNYSAHPATENLGPIGYRLDKGIGLILHDTMAFNRDGTPLGVLDAQCWARDEKDFGKKKRRHKLSIEKKESYKWLISFRKLLEAQRRCPQTTLVSMGDSEADIYELFELALKEPSGPKLLVRASQNRVLAQEQGHLWEKLNAQEVAGIQEVHVARGRRRPARVARLEVRFARISLKPPIRKSKLQELSIWAVLSREVDAPEGVEPIEWMLLSTCPVINFEQAIEKLVWYTRRWGIEVYHRTLKSGCKIEERQLGHQTPDVPCTVFFEEAEWKALNTYITNNPTPPERTPSLREAIRMVPSLGGFLGRKSDGEPGTKSLWIGLQRLDDLTAMWKVMIKFVVPHPQ